MGGDLFYYKIVVGIFGKIRSLAVSFPKSRIIFLLGGLVLLLAIPLTVIVSQQQQTTKQRASGFEDNAANIAQDIGQDLSQINSNPKACGDNCAEEPPVPQGVMTVNYCSQPLTIPSSEVTDEYKSYQNVKNNKEGKDNRYFVYVSKDNADPVRIKVGNVSDIVIEQLAGDSVSFDGNNLTVVGSGAFAIHGNPGRESAIGPCILGAFCSYKDLGLKAEGSKNRIYPSDNCAQLSASISYMAAKKSIDGDGGTGKGLLYAALNKVVDKVFEVQAHVIGNAKPTVSLVSPAAPTTDKIVVNIDMQMGGDPVPLIEGMTYAGATFTKGEAVQPALEFARGLRNLPTPEAKIAAINRWVAENGVYPTEEVIRQLIRDGKFDLAEFASRFFKQSSNSSISQFSHAEETLDNLMSAKLPDGRFMCVCRDASVLGAAMAQEAGVQAWPVEGNATGKPVVLSQDLQALKEIDVSGKGHAWVEFRDSQGKIVGWDPTYALSTDLTTPPKIYNHEFTSAKFPNDFKYSRLLSIPDIFVNNGDILNLSIVDSEGRIVPHRILNFKDAYGLVIEGYGSEEKLTYKIEFKLKDGSKIATVSLASSAGTDISLSSSKFSASTSSKAPIIVDTGRELTPFNQELLPKETADGIRKYNKARSEFIRNHPNTPAELLKTQEEGLTFLKMLLVDGDTLTLTKEEAIAILKDAVTTVEQRMIALSPEGKMQVISDTLATADNSPLKGKMMSLASLKANRSMLFTKGVGVGSNMANILGSPIIADLANSLDNAYLIAAARTTNVVGMGQMAVMGGKTIAQAAIAANVAFKGASGALAARTAVGGIAAGTVVGGAAVSFGAITAGTAVGASFATTLYCATNPTSGMCGCRISGEYGEGKLMLELQGYDVSKGEKVKYRILGFENCPTHVGLEAVFGMVNLANARAPEPKLTTGKDGSARNPIGGQGTQCKWQPDGRWCLGEFTAELDKGSYRLTILQPQILVGNQNPIYLYPHDTGQVLNVDGGGSILVKLVPSLTPVLKLTPSPNPTASALSPFSAYNQCLVICDQGELISEKSFDGSACIQQCDKKYKQSAPTITPTPKITTAPISISPTILTPTPTSIPQTSCPVSLTKADADCFGGVDMNDFNKQRDYAIGGQMTEEQLKLWTSNVWSPAFSSSQ